MEFRILGSLEVVRDGRMVDLGEPKQKAVLGALLLSANAAVPATRLEEALWGESPPVSATKAVQSYVSRLRKVLGEGVIETRGHSYVVHVAPDGLDAARFARLASEGAACLHSAPHLASERLCEALALWRGAPLEGLELEASARQAAERLAEQRLAVVEQRIEADIALGRHAQLVAELQQLVVAYPYREHLRGQLIVALYRCGRQAEALEQSRAARRLLHDELGLNPSSRLQTLERQMLSQAPELDYAAPTIAAAPVVEHGPDTDPAGETVAVEPITGGAGRRRARRGRRVALTGAFAAGGLLIAFLATSLGGSDDARALPRLQANTVGLIDPATNRISDQVAVGATPSHIAVGEGAVWVTNADSDSVSRIDPGRGEVVQTIGVGSSPSGIAVGNGAVWVANSLDATVSRIDPAVNRVVQRIAVGNGPVGIVYAVGSIWVANTGDGTITRVDAESGKPTTVIPVSATELAYGAGYLWASQRAASRVVRIDPQTGTAVPIGVGGGPTGIAFGAGAVWAANSLEGTVTRIDPATSVVRSTIPVGNGPTAIAADGSGVWVSNQFGGTLARIDPREDRVVRRISVGNRPQAVALWSGSVLVSVRQSGAGHRGGTLTVRMNRALDSIDTGLAYDTASWSILAATSDGLVGFDRASGLQGSLLVPDLAVSLPMATDGGRTYTFRLRPGILYSNGRAVKASDFRYSVERQIRLGGVTQYFAGILGAARCRRAPERCDLSRGIVTDDARGTVTFHLVAPDPEFLYATTFDAVPAGTSSREAGKAGAPPLPATGPYVITSYRPKQQITLRRNPHFHEWSQAAQPDGYPDRIVVQMGGTPDEAVNAVIEGHADAFSSAQSENPPSERLLAALETRHASQVHTNPQAATVYLFLNTRLPPFNRLDARRALNYAVDRAAAVRLLGGPGVAQATCQILPAHSPGYRPYCPYTAGSTTLGRWRSPDLRRARALVARSGTRGMKVTVWSWSDLGSLGPFTVKLLRSLGYRVSLEVPDGDRYFAITDDTRTRVQIGIGEWIADYPAASGFFAPVLTCAAIVPRSPANLNAGLFCNPRIDEQVERAAAEEATDPVASRRLWQRIDRQTVDQAPWVPLVNPDVVDVLSKRVGNYQFAFDGLGLLIDQLWVR